MPQSLFNERPPCFSRLIRVQRLFPRMEIETRVLRAQSAQLLLNTLGHLASSLIQPCHPGVWKCMRQINQIRNLWVEEKRVETQSQAQPGKLTFGWAGTSGRASVELLNILYDLKIRSIAEFSANRDRKVELDGSSDWHSITMIAGNRRTFHDGTLGREPR